MEPASKPDALDIKIVGHEIVNENGTRPFVQYFLQVSKGGRSITISRRFRDILALVHEKVGKLYNLSAPSKHIFSTGEGTDKAFITERKKELQDYFQQLTKINGIQKHPLLKDFLELSSLEAMEMLSPKNPTSQNLLMTVSQ